jgi:nitroreductase
MPHSIAEINTLKQAPVEGLLPALSHRWSPRSFAETPVPSSDLKLVLEAARWAASSSNLQPWRFFVGVQGTETHAKIFSTLVGFNRSWADKAPVLILGAAFLKSEGSDKPNAYALYDLGQAVSQLIIQASALGLMAHSMGGFEHDAARQAFELNEDYAIGAVTALGYQAEPGALANEKLIERELAPRSRKPLSEIALTALGTPLAL